MNSHRPTRPAPGRSSIPGLSDIRRVALAALALCLAACGGAGDDSESTAGTAAVGTEGSTAEAAAAAQGGYQRSSFVLCEAFDTSHFEELAAIVGFEADESGSILSSECMVKGPRVAFARVKLQPAMAPSAEAVAKRSYDGEASPAPEMGDGAWYVADGLQPHVIFPMGDLIIDVNAENESTPDRETMIELALRVREILREANG